MGSEDQVYEWAKEKMNFCPGSSTLTKADLKQAYKGPMKEVLDSMAKCLRSVEDVQKVRNFTKEQTIRDLLQRKAAAESMVQTLMAENAALEEKCSVLETKESEINSSLEKAMEKEAVLETCAKLTKNQCEAIKGLRSQSKLLGHKISPNFCKNNQTLNSESSGFIFNPTHNKLETVLKGEVRKIIEELSSKKPWDEICYGVQQMVSKYSGQERWKVILELQNELAAQADEMNQSVCLQKDAETLSKELEDEDLGTDIVRPLQLHLDTLTLEHTDLMMKRLHRAREIKALEKQLQELLTATPEANSEVEEAKRNAQTAQLHKSLAKLISQNQKELNAQSETSKNILQIHNFKQETEIRKNKIVGLLGLLQDAAQLTDQLQTENKEISHELQIDLESVSQLPDILQSQLGLLAENTADSLFETKSSISTCVVLNDDAIKNIITTKSRLRFLKSYLDAMNKEDFSVSDSESNEDKIEEIRKSIEEQEMTLQQNICKLQQSFAEEQEQCTQNLAEQLKFWKENPIVERLKCDKTYTVSDMTLDDWMKYAEQCLASGN